MGDLPLFGGEVLRERIGREFDGELHLTDDEGGALADLINATHTWVHNRGWGVIDDEGRCYSCLAQIATDDHDDDCTYDRLAKALDHALVVIGHFPKPSVTDRSSDG